MDWKDDLKDSLGIKKKATRSPFFFASKLTMQQKIKIQREEDIKIFSAIMESVAIASAEGGYGLES
jgi:hypothetical protein